MDLWNTILAWLHSVGLHVDKDTATTVGQAADQVCQVVAQAGQAVSQWDWSSLMALAAALGWASGFRLYAVVFVTGMLGATGWLQLPGGLSVLQQPVSTLMISAPVVSFASSERVLYFARYLRMADGPDEVHMAQLAKLVMASLGAKATAGAR